ncbi:hyalin repeat-containing protein [Corallococcus coralloides]|uniref:Hyalin repeat-containing protein n=1 Tax=Corallococcus coralloides TaxID=184914 RepID=A0A410S1H5_CORCK|nr:HYR domain-containing protein [Corallococcus coralloides]QAT88059.1 hyalin repeat-containing protein [Corallococcus coralloides]
MVLVFLTGLVACDAGRLPEGADGESLAQVEAALDGGSVELRSNVLRGTVRLTNQNPEVLAVLAADPWVQDAGTVTATSTAPAGFRAIASPSERISPLEYRFEMSVEAGAGGDAGVVYSVAATRGGYAHPALSGVTVRPVAVQPEPTDVTVQSCMGLVQFRFGTDETCQTRVPLAGLNIRNFLFHGTGPYTAYVNAGTTQATTLTYTLSTSTGAVTRTIPVQVGAACDEVVRMCIPVAPPAPPAVGSMTGAFEIHGEPIHGSSRILIPGGNSRNQVLHGPWRPVSAPATWWTVSDLPVNAYPMNAIVYLRSGRGFTEAYTPDLEPFLVVAGQTTPMTKQVDGVSRHAFDIHPAYFYGSVRLADPFIPAHPGARSTLQSLFFEADHDANGDGTPDVVSIGNRGTAFVAEAPGGSSRTSFPGTFDVTRGELASTYEHVLPGPYDLTYRWFQGAMYLRFWSEPTGSAPFSTRPGLYDPERFRYGSLALRTLPVSGYTADLGPGQRFRIDHEYCFNEVQLQYTSTQGRFFNPTVEVSAQFTGKDWRGQPVAYVANGSFYGTPAAVNVTNPAQYADTQGQVSLALPQGSFTLRPGASMVSESGTVNTATFAPLGVTLGCGQRVKLVPPLAVSLDGAPGCATSASGAVSGQVKSLPAQVDRIWYRLNGGPEVNLCTNCGIDPRFSFHVPLQACDNAIQVFAFSEGMSEPATAIEQRVWDDPADGPSCGAGSCVNRPPVARCRSVTVPAGGACSGCGSVDDGSYDPDPGDAVSCVQTPACPYPLGSHRATLTCTDSAGLSASCEATVTVRDETPPAVVCGTVPELECDGGGATASFTATATDNCGAVTTTCAPASGGLFPPGTTTATCTATDGAGLRTQCNVPVTVRDTQPPTLVCPAPVIVERTGPEGATVAPGTATASDTCAPPGVSGPAAGVYPVGTTAVTYTATDLGGNQASCVSNIHVTDPELGNPPNVTMCNLPRYTRETNLMACGWTTPVPGNAPITSAFFRVDGGAPIPVTPDLSGGFVITWLDLEEGTHVVELTAIDTRGAILRRRMTVTVDLTPPVLAILSPLADDVLASPVVTVRSSIEDASPTTVRTQWVESSQLETGRGTVTHTVDLVNWGQVALLVSATDAAGNTTQQLTQVFVGATPPALRASAPVP